MLCVWGFLLAVTWLCWRHRRRQTPFQHTLNRRPWTDHDPLPLLADRLVARSRFRTDPTQPRLRVAEATFGRVGMMPVTHVTEPFTRETPTSQESRVNDAVRNCAPSDPIAPS